MIKGTSIAADGHGNCIVTGTLHGSVNIDGTTLASAPGATDFFVIKLGPAGKAIWAKSFGGGAGASGISMR